MIPDPNGDGTDRELDFMYPGSYQSDFPQGGEEGAGFKKDSDCLSYQEPLSNGTQQFSPGVGTGPNSQPVTDGRFMNVLYNSYPMVNSNLYVFNDGLFQWQYVDNKLTLYLPSEVSQLEIVHNNKSRVVMLQKQVGSNTSNGGSNSSRHDISYLHDYIKLRYSQLHNVVLNNSTIGRKIAANTILLDVFGCCDPGCVEIARKVRKQCPPIVTPPKGREPMPPSKTIKNFINKNRGW